MIQPTRCSCLFVVLLGACCGDDYATRDERMIREQLQLPKNAELVRLDGIPNAPGAWQREGLRIDASFLLAKPERDAYRPIFRSEWVPVPVPANVASFRSPPPAAMLSHAKGHYLCRVMVYRPNTNIVASTHACRIAPPRFDSYVLATYDDSTGEMRAWLKHYF